VARAFLLTDVQGSTRLWEQEPEAMSSALVRHDEIVRAAVEAQKGTLKPARGEGDSHFAVFDDSSAAVLCAVAIQDAMSREDWPTGEPVRTRVAVHWGEAEERDSEFYGTTVNRAARLRAIAHGGQIVVSAEVVTHSRGLAGNLRFVDRGRHRLKDLQEPLQVFEVRLPEWDEEFPPLDSLDSRRHNLPQQLTTFVGRTQELAALVKLVDEGDRLITLLGPGGVGKTRLSLQAGAELADSFPDGVWFVELAEIADADRLLPAIVATLGSPTSDDLLESLVSFLERRRLMLILDNCEQVVEEVARLVEDLTRRSEGLTVLATSRERLGIPGERVTRLEGLACPEEGDDLAPRYPAFRLIADRVSAAGYGEALQPESMAAITRICRRLDGVPLALELAASRVGVLSPDEIDRRLSDVFSALGPGPRTLDARQRTLRGAIDWSHDLLSQSERALFRRVGVFVGGFTLEAAEEVCGFDPLDPSEVLDLLGALVDKSLVVVDPSGPTTRYRMLETISAYARDRAEEAGETPALADRHLRWVGTWVDRPRPGSRSGFLPRGEFDAESGNIRAALDHAVITDARTGLQILWAALESWEVDARLAEGAQRVRAMLESHPESDAARLYGLSLLGVLTIRLGDLATAQAALESAVELARSLGHDERLSACLVMLAQISVDTAGGDPAPLLDEALALARKTGERSAIANALGGIGRMECERDTAAAITAFEEALALRRELGEVNHVLPLLENLAAACHKRGDLPEARRAAEEAKALARSMDAEEAEATISFTLGRLMFESGELESAEALFEEARDYMRSVGIAGGEAYAWALLGETSRVRGDLDAAEIRFGEALSCLERTGQTLSASFIRGNLGHLALGRGEVERARALAASVLRVAAEHEVVSLVVEMLELHAEIDAATGEAERALRAFGAAKALRDEAGFGRDAPDEPDFQAGMEQATAQAGARASELMARGAQQGHEAMAKEYLAAFASD
jgi:predicted ATPase/class 3 adenylate cyclase